MPQQNASSYQQLIAADKTLLIYKNIPAVLISHMLGCLPLAFVVWNAASKRTVIIWLVLLYLLSIIRAVHHYRFQPDIASPVLISDYRRLSLLFIALTGAVWGLAGVWFFDPDSVATYSFLILTLVCMISGSMNSVSPMPPAYMYFSVLAMGPIIVITLIQGTSFYTLMGIAAFIYLLITVIFSRNLSHAIDDSLAFKYANEELVEKLQIQTSAAEKANLDKSRFLAAASHDVRQPLHAANLFVDALGNQFDRDDQQQNLQGVRKSLDSLGELFDALLNISRIDANITQVNKQHFNLDVLVADVKALFAQDADAKGIVLQHHHCQHVVYTDRAQFKQILVNLLSNAVRYTRQGKVEIFCDQLSDDDLRLHVKDTGIGIAKSDLQPIFEEFVQLNNPERDRDKGMGLGLAIAQRLAEMLQLPLGVNSMPDKGSDFYLCVPLGDQHKQVLPEKALLYDSKHLAGLRVLVVDNEPQIITAMQRLLENWQCQVLTAESTAQALKLVESNIQLDMLITDYRMPGELSGLQLIKTILQQRGKIPCLLISGDTSQDILIKAQRDNVLLLHKPVKAVQLHMAITQALSKARAK